ncbi:DUF6588 family protein [Nonlabens sp.]|uniref:DUF6588 family protein n=1 Tax=Nonlabens sp. TaxID=1888209 RepID=UPI003F69B72E
MKTFLNFSFIILILLGSQESQSQLGLNEVATDILFIIDGYNEPAAEASVMQTGAGWFHTAKSLDLFKTNIAIGISGLPFPNSKKNFTVKDSDFSNVDIRDGDQASIPTTLGGRGLTFFDFEIDGEAYEFQAFSGIRSDLFAMPYIQGQIGLWKETELTLRLVPQLVIDKSSYAVYGLGLKHNISQYLFKENRTLEIAVYGNYNLTDLNIDFEEPLELAPSNGNPPLAILDGSLIDFHSINTGLVVSKDLNKWTFSTSLNYNTSWVDYSLTGEKSLFLNIFNDALTTLSATKHSFRGDIGAAYQITPKWNINSQFSAGQFVNLNISGIYSIN